MDVGRLLDRRPHTGDVSTLEVKTKVKVKVQF